MKLTNLSSRELFIGSFAKHDVRNAHGLRAGIRLAPSGDPSGRDVRDGLPDFLYHRESVLSELVLAGDLLVEFSSGGTSGVTQPELDAVAASIPVIPPIPSTLPDLDDVSDTLTPATDHHLVWDSATAVWSSRRHPFPLPVPQLVTKQTPTLHPPYAGDALSAPYREPVFYAWLPPHQHDLSPYNPEIWLMRYRRKTRRRPLERLRRRGKTWVHPAHREGTKWVGRFHAGHPDSGVLRDTEWPVSGNPEHVLESGSLVELTGLDPVTFYRDGWAANPLSPGDFPVHAPPAAGSVEHGFSPRGESLGTKNKSVVLAVCLTIDNPEHATNPKAPPRIYSDLSESVTIVPLFAYDGPPDPANRYIYGLHAVHGRGR